MAVYRRYSLPLVTAFLVGLPVFWAFPEELPFWRSTAIVAGWLGSGLILASLLLMIREAWLAEALGGLERMYRWHHLLGVVAYPVLLFHPLALAVDVRVESPALAWSLLDPRQQSWPTWLGWASLLTMMLGLGLALARRLSYGRWRWLHLLLAFSVVVAVLHLLLLGLSDLLLWAPMLAIAFLIWRFVRADAGLAARPYVVTRVDYPGANMIEVRMRALGEAIPARAGQFVLAAFSDGPRFHGFGEYHPFTLSGIAPDGQISMGIKALGDHTRRLQSIPCGTAVRVQGPYGDFFADSADSADSADAPAVWIAGGIGITPFIARLRARPVGQPTLLLYLFRNTAEAAYADELREIASRQDKLALRIAPTGDEWPDLVRILPGESDLAGRHCFLCGPTGLVDSSVDILAKRGVPDSSIHFERFDFR